MDWRYFIFFLPWIVGRPPLSQGMAGGAAAGVVSLRLFGGIIAAYALTLILFSINYFFFFTWRRNKIDFTFSGKKNVCGSNRFYKPKKKKKRYAFMLNVCSAFFFLFL